MKFLSLSSAISVRVLAPFLAVSMVACGAIAPEEGAPLGADAAVEASGPDAQGCYGTCPAGFSELPPSQASRCSYPNAICKSVTACGVTLQCIQPAATYCPAPTCPAGSKQVPSCPSGNLCGRVESCSEIVSQTKKIYCGQDTICEALPPTCDDFSDTKGAETVAACPDNSNQCVRKEGCSGAIWCKLPVGYSGASTCPSGMRMVSAPGECFFGGACERRRGVGTPEGLWCTAPKM